MHEYQVLGFMDDLRLPHRLDMVSFTKIAIAIVIYKRLKQS